MVSREHLASLHRDRIETSMRYEATSRKLDLEADRIGDRYFEIGRRAELLEEAGSISLRIGKRYQAKIIFSDASDRRELCAAKLLESGDQRHAAYEFAKAAEDAEKAGNKTRQRSMSEEAAKSYMAARDGATNIDDKALFGVLAANSMNKAGIFSINDENVREVHVRAVSDYESSSKHPIVRILINRSPLSRGRLF